MSSKQKTYVENISESKHKYNSKFMSDKVERVTSIYWLGGEDIRKSSKDESTLGGQMEGCMWVLQG